MSNFYYFSIKLFLLSVFVFKTKTDQQKKSLKSQLNFSLCEKCHSIFTMRKRLGGVSNFKNPSVQMTLCVFNLSLILDELGNYCIWQKMWWAVFRQITEGLVTAGKKSWFFVIFVVVSFPKLPNFVCGCWLINSHSWENTKTTKHKNHKKTVLVVLCSQCFPGRFYLWIEQKSWYSALKISHPNHP